MVITPGCLSHSVCLLHIDEVLNLYSQGLVNETPVREVPNRQR